MTASSSAALSMQARVFAFLADRPLHPHVDRIDTHGASIFLEGYRAEKPTRCLFA
jgi:hypothetical protein